MRLSRPSPNDKKQMATFYTRKFTESDVWSELSFFQQECQWITGPWIGPIQRLQQENDHSDAKRKERDTWRDCRGIHYRGSEGAFGLWCPCYKILIVRQKQIFIRQNKKSEEMVKQSIIRSS